MHACMHVDSVHTLRFILCMYAPIHPAIKFTKSRHRGHPARYWFELVSSYAIEYLHHYLDHSAHNQHRRDFLGLKQMLQSSKLFGDRLITAPTRAPYIFQLYSKTVGSAWHS